MTCQYTGLPVYSVFTTLFDLLKPFVFDSALKPEAAAKAESTAKDHFYATLHHNVPMVDLAYCLYVSEATVSKFFTSGMDLMYNNLRQLIIWPDTETLRQNYTVYFKVILPKQNFEQPLLFTARAPTYSNCKKHNTVKVFICIASTSAIVFISSAWGGRVSDKVITQQCRFLNLIDPGDVILAERGFNVHDDIAIRGGKLQIPAFTKGKKQLSREEVE